MLDLIHVKMFPPRFHWGNGCEPVSSILQVKATCSWSTSSPHAAAVGFLLPFASALARSTTGNRLGCLCIHLWSRCASVAAHLIHGYELRSGFLQQESEKRNSCEPPLVCIACWLSCGGSQSNLLSNLYLLFLSGHTVAGLISPPIHANNGEKLWVRCTWMEWGKK